MARWGVQRRLDVLVAVVVVGLLVTIWVVQPRSSMSVDDPNGVVADAEMFMDLEGTAPEVDADFIIRAGAGSCPHYGGELEAELQRDGAVRLSWQVETRGDCDDVCEAIWVAGTLAPEFRDAELRLRGLDCGTTWMSQ